MTELAPDPRRLFPRAPMGPPTLGHSCRPLAYTRVYSLDTLEGREGSLLVLARHRLGAALSRMVSRVGDGSDGTTVVTVVTVVVTVVTVRPSAPSGRGDEPEQCARPALQ